MSRKVLTGILLLVVALGWAACGGAAPAPSSALNEQAVDGASRQAAATAAPAAGMPPSLENRMIIQRAEISMVIKDTEATAAAIRTLALNSGGYIADSNLFRDGEQLRGVLTVRIPGQNLPVFLDQVKGMAVRVLRDNLSGEDVTQEYTDLGSRLRNLEATETELLALLTEVRQRPNAKTSDILEVYDKLTLIRGEIEQIKGRMQYLSNLTSLATIQIELIPDELGAPVIEEGWQPLVALRQASARLIKTLQGLVDAAIWLVIFIVPVLLVMALPFVLLALVIRALRRRSPRSSPPPTTTPLPAAESSEKADS